MRFDFSLHQQAEDRRREAEAASAEQRLMRLAVREEGEQVSILNRIRRRLGRALIRQPGASLQFGRSPSAS